jgi:peptidyl-prolyl cis-trans isomerase B (cyclophilin B)
MRLVVPVALAIVFGFAGAPRAEPTVALETSMGTIMLELDRAHAPKTVDNFLRYVSEGHYDDTFVYRVAPGFVIQAGSFDSATHARPVHDPIPLESGNGLNNLRGTIAMARQADPNSATAEFFINLANNAALDRQPGDADGATGYAVFGHVTSGMDVVDKIAALPVGPGGPMPGAWPQTPVKVEKVSVLAAPAPPAAPRSTRLR